MADFRRWIPALAVLVLLIGLTSTASAQIALTCNATVVPPALRAEGLTELVGDIVLSCTGGTPQPAGVLPTANISVFLNAPVTSRLSGSGVTNGAETLLIIDDPATAQQNGCVGALGGSTCLQNGNGVGNEFKTGAAANVYQGGVSGSTVTFNGVPIDPPGTTGVRTFRITNVRVNATAVAPGGSGTPGQVVALVSATPATIGASGQTGTLAINNSQVTVGFVQTSMSFSLVQGNNGSGPSIPVAIRQCSSFASSKTTASAILQYKELFPTAFKTRTTAPDPSPIGTAVSAAPAPAAQSVPGFIYNTETGFYNPALAAPYNAAGLADNGTRLKAVFNNIPAGVNIWVSTLNIGNGTISNNASMTGSEYGAFFAVPATDTSDYGDSYYGPLGAGGVSPVVQLPVVNGTATAVWETFASSATATDTFNFGVWFTTTANVSGNSPAPGTGTVNGSYGTIYTSATGGAASSTLQIPRFVDTSSAKNILAVNVCRTSILFPFVTNQAGFDTGLAISNTTTDPFGTAAQAGACTLNFYGANAPAPITSSSVASGTTATWLASSAAPNFQGYVIAVCNFQLGHGFAFVSDVGARNLAMGYLGLVLPDPPRQGSGVSLTAGSGETLAQ
ncbi:MAG TPA: hypothetical protein VFA33_08785 [Bryobacteraceae bacterium]|nr:hypothetical protein [Bryobacteraceae bacterium]